MFRGTTSRELNKTQCISYKRKLLSDFQKIPEIVTVPADKGTAIVCENKNEYMSGKKMIC